MSVQRDEWDAIADGAAARAAAWIATLADDPAHAERASRVGGEAQAAVRSDLLEGSRRDADAFGFTRRLLDAVVGASDPFNAALGLREVSRDLPQTMPAVERIAVRAGGFASLGLPWAVLPVARKWLRDRVAHLVVSAKIDELPAVSDGTESKTIGSRGTDASDSDTNTTAGVSPTNVAASQNQHTHRIPSALRSALARADVDGSEAIVALAGTGVLGDEAAARELRRLLALVKLAEVPAVALDVSRLVPQGGSGAWALDHDAEIGAARLRELFESAERHDTLILLESHDYRSSLLAPQMLVKALAGAEFASVRVGVALPAELPESLQTAEALAAFSRARVSAGATPLEIVVGISGAVGPEQIDSILSGLAVAAIEDRTAQNAQLLRVLVPLFEAGDAVRVVVASEDVHVLAAATVLAERIGHGSTPTLQLRAGTAPQLEAVAVDHGFRVRRRLVLVRPKEFSGAVEYLIALSAEIAEPDSTLATTRSLFAGDGAQLGLGARRIREVLAQAAMPAPTSRRVQHREREWSEDARDTVVFYRSPAEASRFETGGLTAAVLGLTRAHTGAITLEVTGAPLRIPVISDSGFANEPDTDASRYENRVWVRNLISRAGSSSDGIDRVRNAEGAGEDPLASIDRVLLAGESWRSLRAVDRGTRVSRLALGVASARDRLTEVLVAETGAPMPVIDSEVNMAIDAARYLGPQASHLGAVRGAEFHPDHLAVVVAEAGVPFGERAEAVLAALAAGSAVVLVTHSSVARSSAALIEEWEAAGLPAGVVALAVPKFSEDAGSAQRELAAGFVVDQRVDRALVLGRRETARLLQRRRPDLRIEGRFRTLGTVVITPSADPARAARDAVASAFGAMHADATIASAIVLLGPAARSESLRGALVDAVTSLRVGDTARPDGRDPLSFELGPLPELPSEEGLRALTELDEGESWLVKPERLDEEGLLWRPGVRTGLVRGARFWADSVGMPVIGVITAHSVDDAIALSNILGGGGVAGLHAGDPAESLPWLERTEAARLVVGRATTGGRIERQAAGGMRVAGMGVPALAGGPHRLQSLGSWELREGTASPTLHLRGLSPEIRMLIEVAQASLDYQSFDRVRRAALSDALAWRTSFGRAHDVSGLGIERNLLRHRSVSTHVRLAEGAALAGLIRVVAAGVVARAPMTVSTGVVLPPEITEVFAMHGVSVALERDDFWLERISINGPGDGELSAKRIRLIGGNRARTAEWLSGLDDVTLWAEPVTMAGPVELLTFVNEQAISIAAHRHGLALLPSGIGGWIAELQGRE